MQPRVGWSSREEAKNVPNGHVHLGIADLGEILQTQKNPFDDETLLVLRTRSAEYLQKQKQIDINYEMIRSIQFRFGYMQAYYYSIIIILSLNWIELKMSWKWVENDHRIAIQFPWNSRENAPKSLIKWLNKLLQKHRKMIQNCFNKYRNCWEIISTLNMVGVRENATRGRADINAARRRFKISAGGKMSHTIIGITRLRSSAS